MLEAETTIPRGAQKRAYAAALLCTLALAACGKSSPAAQPAAPSAATAPAASAPPKPDAANPLVGTWVGDVTPGQGDMLVGCKFTADLAGCYSYLQVMWQPQRVQFKVNGDEIEVQPETTSNVEIYKMIDHDTMKMEVGDTRWMPDSFKRCPQNDPEACETFARHVFGLDNAKAPAADSSGSGAAAPVNGVAKP
jgi:hypothetical protein